jgi:hypothetical protein
MISGTFVEPTVEALEGIVARAETNDLWSRALGEYRGLAKFPDDVGSPTFNGRLLLQGLLAEEVDGVEPTGFGMLAKTSAGEQESRTLAALRDALLPRLVSGELRVPNTKHVIERIS